MIGDESASQAIAPAEPSRTSLLDLAMLVLGVAAILRLPWLGGGFDYLKWPLRPKGFQFAYHTAISLDEAVEWLSLALLPAAFARRARYGGLARPGEYLIRNLADR